MHVAPPVGTMGVMDPGLGVPRVRVVKHKRVGPAAADWEAVLVSAESRRLVWATPAGALRDRPRRMRTEVVATAEVTASTARWWIATRIEEPRPHWKIDAVTPPRLGPDGVLRFTDLDVDLVLGPGRRVALRDLGQMLRRTLTWRYPPRIVAGALLGIAAALVRRALGRWPFDGSLERRPPVTPAAPGAGRPGSARRGPPSRPPPP